MLNPSTKLMTAKEVSDLLRIPVSTLWSLTKKGKIRGIKIGKHWRYLESDVQSFLDAGSDGSHAVGRAEISERRISPRINCEVPAELSVLIPERNHIQRSGVIRNLGEGGAHLIYQGRGLEVGDPVKVSFVIPDKNGERIELEGRVIYQSTNGKHMIGIKFKNVPDKCRKAIRDYVG